PRLVLPAFASIPISPILYRKRYPQPDKQSPNTKLSLLILYEAGGIHTDSLQMPYMICSARGRERDVIRYTKKDEGE
ncbi:MAG: hypothetical protein SO414_02665, partial [Bacteroidaceae bacterium]|nr:hypothetical protein [Bacteroidaceae bacterium]